MGLELEVKLMHSKPIEIYERIVEGGYTAHVIGVVVVVDFDFTFDEEAA